MKYRTIETPATDGLLTEEILSRAMNEIEEVRRGLFEGNGRDEWLAECGDRLDNALRDVSVARQRFHKAQG